ncbi:hypothetical protein [Sphingobacterium spiritivorum]|uniref:hypothetical protein n=1 Tax=Sphingobacterium spiritivorum TaxID=258 RepID=UPI003DA237BE
MILKNRFYNQILSSIFSIIISLVLILLFFIFDMESGIIPYLILLIFLGDFPAWYIHITYFIKNKGVVVNILNEEIIVTKGNESITYTKDEIESVITVRPKTDVMRHPSLNYFYIKIIFINKDLIYITCLMSRDVEKVLAALDAVEKKKVEYRLGFLK